MNRLIAKFATAVVWWGVWWYLSGILASESIAKTAEARQLILAAVGGFFGTTAWVLGWALYDRKLKDR